MLYNNYIILSTELLKKVFLRIDLVIIMFYTLGNHLIPQSNKNVFWRLEKYDSMDKSYAI